MVLEIEKLNKSFNEVHAVKDLSFHVNEGELFAFLGVNGAGKSTTINIICDYLKKDSGKVIVDGVDIDKDPFKIKKSLGVVFQNCVLDKPLTVKENLLNRAALYHIYGKDFKNRLDELADLLDFKRLLNRRVDKLSGGERRRVDIARAIFHNPKILILDEPTTGLDPQTRKLLWQVLSDLRKRQKLTIILTTHYMEEASDADYVIIIDQGVKVAEGTPLELKNKYTGDYIRLYHVSEDEVKALNLSYEPLKDGYKILVKDTTEATKLILAHPDLFKDYEIIKGQMDDVFLKATGKNLEGGLK